MAGYEQSLPYIRAISPYQPGKPITQLAREMGLAVEQIVKLASNENPLGMSPKARAAVTEAIAGLARYPDDFALKQALAERTGLGRSASSSAMARMTCSISSRGFFLRRGARQSSRSMLLPFIRWRRWRPVARDCRRGQGLRP
jgi:hypothetical protein